MLSGRGWLCNAVNIFQVVPQSPDRRAYDRTPWVRAGEGVGVMLFDVLRDTLRDVPLPGGPIRVLRHPLVCRKVDPSEVDRAIPSASSSLAKRDRIATERYVAVIDVSLAVGY